jgi:hypothetical protein
MRRNLRHFTGDTLANLAGLSIPGGDEDRSRRRPLAPVEQVTVVDRHA